MTKGVTKENIFEAVIKYHFLNLEDSLRYFDNGKVRNFQGEVLIEGISENPHYSGAYLVYDGDTILDKVSQRIVRKNGIKESETVPTIEAFVDRLRDENDSDSVFLYNTEKQKITKVKGEFSNYCHEDLESLLENALPKNFLSADGSMPVYEVGTKTANAALTARVLNQRQDYGVKTLVVKKTAYGELGMGKIAEFGKHGLTREFFFEYAPQHRGPFIDEKNKIIGVLREYGPSKAKPLSESYVSFAPQGEIRYVPTSVALKKAA
ncbi:hypothetical protein HZC30_07640 [Candidatus Woesearchaeota archaeon]|nr:hypothetical protein [Candidatus Woesearchaeota archaeon]